MNFKNIKIFTYISYISMICGDAFWIYSLYTVLTYYSYSYSNCEDCTNNSIISTNCCTNDQNLQNDSYSATTIKFTILTSSYGLISVIAITLISDSILNKYDRKFYIQHIFFIRIFAIFNKNYRNDHHDRGNLILLLINAIVNVSCSIMVVIMIKNDIKILLQGNFSLTIIFALLSLVMSTFVLLYTIWSLYDYNQKIVDIDVLRSLKLSTTEKKKKIEKLQEMINLLDENNELQKLTINI